MKKRNLVGESIRRLRTEQNLTQEELALRSGLSQGYINQLENGKRKFTQKSLELVSKALSTPIMEFFREKDAFPAPLVKEEMAEYGGTPAGRRACGVAKDPSCSYSRALPDSP